MWLLIAWPLHSLNFILIQQYSLYTIIPISQRFYLKSSQAYKAYKIKIQNPYLGQSTLHELTLLFPKLQEIGIK